jgi:hypothetical protein
MARSNLTVWVDPDSRMAPFGESCFPWTCAYLTSTSEDIPLGSLHTQFNCNFSIVSQTNPHIHLFFFAPRGSVGRPVAHRKGKGWRGGFILSALESYIKLDLSKHFKVSCEASCWGDQNSCYIRLSGILTSCRKSCRVIGAVSFSSGFLVISL